MLFSNDRELEDRIVELLTKGVKTVKTLHHSISKELTDGITLRAVYKSVNKLIRAGVLIKVGKQVLLDQEWLQQAVLNLSQERLLPLLGTGERATYTLSSVEHMDTYWKTIVSQIQQEEKGFPLFIFNPHDFWLFIPERKKSEEAYYRNFDIVREYGFFVIGGVCEADKLFKQTYQSNYFQIDLSDAMPFKRTDHITTIGNYVIVVSIAFVTAKRIDNLYQKNISQEKLEYDVQKCVEKLNKIKINIENNPAKAKRLRKRLAKNFYIPNELKERFDIF